MNDKVFLWPKAQDWWESLRWVYLTFSLLIGLTLGGSFVNYERVVNRGHPWLPSVRCTGCRFCGMTRSFCAMSSGHWQEAAQWNRGGPVLYVSCWLWLISGSVAYLTVWRRKTARGITRGDFINGTSRSQNAPAVAHSGAAPRLDDTVFLTGWR